jgi:hypothetical protein
VSKKFVLAGVVVAAVAVTAGSVGASSATADPGNGAIIQHNAYGVSFCFVLDGNGGYWFIDNCVFDIVTSPDGTVNETLKGTVDPSTPPPTHAFTGSDATTGQGCDFVSGATHLVADTISPSGRLTAKCSSD